MLTIAVTARHRMVAQGMLALVEQCGYAPAKEEGSADVTIVDLTQSRMPPAPAPGTALALIGGEESDCVAALRAGYRGVLGPDAGRSVLVEAVAAVMRGEVWAPRSVLASALDPDRPTPLTCREHDVLKLVARGLSNKRIGDELGITEKTVKAHVSRLLMKFNVDNRYVLALRVRRD
jgi:DNA-binding NarL/FixJ family response regulator